MNYYEIIVAAARMVNNPRISWREAQKVICGFVNLTKTTINEEELKKAWREFSSAKASKIVYSR